MRSYTAGGCVAYLGWLVESRNSPLVTSSQKSLAFIVSNLDFSAARADEDCRRFEFAKCTQSATEENGPFVNPHLPLIFLSSIVRCSAGIGNGGARCATGDRLIFERPSPAGVQGTQ
jgi:hypothetical protein